jgi:DNA-binding GntR family transcriptional regulator
MNQAGGDNAQWTSNGEAIAAATQVAAALREEIIVGQLPPRTRLKDAVVAQRHQVSRNTAREALRELEREGLVTSRPYAGSSVRALTEVDAHDIYRVRRTIEAAGIEASTGASPAQLKQLSGFVDAARRAAAEGSWSDVGTNSLRVHQGIVALLGSPRLDEFFATILAQLRLVFALMDNESSMHVQWIDRDHDLVLMLQSGKRRQALLELQQYLADSEAQIIDAIRASSAWTR